MTKQDILNTTGLSEEEFYQRYPDQETFCSEYPDMCPEMMDDNDEEDISNYQNLGYNEDEINMAAYGGSLYEAQNGVQTTAPYTDYNQYKNAMQTYATEAVKANTYNNFQNDLYSQSGKQRGFSETPRQMGDMFNTLSPELQDAMAAKYNFEFVPAGTPSANRRNYINSMVMNIPGKGMGYYSFPKNDVVYGSKVLERPKYDFPRMNAAQYQMPNTPPANFQGKPINYQPGTANINFGNTTPQPKKFAIEPAQLINNIGASYKDPASLNASNGNLPIPKYSLNRTMEKVGATNQPIVRSTPNYKSIVDLLKARKQDSSFSNRKKLAEERGIKNYTGTASQNMELINNIDDFNPYDSGMELGGVNIHPAMRTNFKQGGYYGMDGKLHRAKGSGTYVMNGGYYFDEGGVSTAPPVASPDTPPGAVGAPIAVPPSSLINSNMPNEDGTFNVNNDYNYYGGYDGTEDDGGFQTQNERALKRQARRQERRNTIYETPDLGGLDFEYEEEQQQEEPVVEPYDASQYSSGIDPATGFTTWSKGNKQLTNIKKQDPALWGHLKDEGHGARWRTGQTDIQKFGRGAGRLANNLQTGIDVASAFGNVLNNRNEQRNLNNTAINQGSTASMYTNPQAAGKGTGPGQTGSSYGMMNPASIGARSFTGMYNTGKYGMEVPKYDIGGGFSNLFTSAQSVIPINNPINLMPANLSFTNSGFSPFQNNQPIIDNTGVYQNNAVVNETNSNTNNSTTLDPDFALQAMGLSETSSKPGESKTGLRTKIVGEGGKRASASGTFQITNDTLQDIYNNDKSISSKYGSFNKFKSAFDTDAKVEYEAAKSLMSRHIKNYGIFALGAWYYPEFARKAAAGDKSVFDIVPRRDFGNSVKWGDDFNKKLKAYNKLAGTNYTPTTVFNAPSRVAQTSKTSKGNKPHKQQGTSWHADYNRFENPMLRPTLKEVMKSFPGTSLNGVWPNPEHLEKNPNSDHNTGDGLDITIQNIDQGNKVTEKLIREAKAKNIKYIIFNSRIWDAKTNTWSAYSGDNPHKTHVHASFYPYRKKQLGGQVVEMDEDEITQFLKAGGQLEFLD
jgi:peptidoglycan L-alanyl-D-glutamate endopeptidase CwlK